MKKVVKKTGVTLAPRALDHLVLPVRFLDVAQARYEALGFTVSPVGVHPFGTENACVLLPDDTMLEPLAIGHRETCEAEAVAGNTFVAIDQTYRFRRGDEGFSCMVLKSDDAEADDAAYRASGMSGGPMVPFERTSATPDGYEARMAVNLAFAADRRAPDAQFFTCQDVVSPDIDRSALKRHENGATGLSGVLMSEPNPTDFQYFMQVLLNQREMEADSFGMSFEAENGNVSVMTPRGLQAFYGIEAEPVERGMRFVGFSIAVSDISPVAGLLAENDVACRTHMERIIVPPAPGQGCTIIFEGAAQ